MKLLLLYRSEEETYWMDLVFLGCWDGSETSYSCKFCDCFYKTNRRTCHEPWSFPQTCKIHCSLTKEKGYVQCNIIIHLLNNLRCRFFMHRPVLCVLNPLGPSFESCFSLTSIYHSVCLLHMLAVWFSVTILMGNRPSFTKLTSSKTCLLFKCTLIFSQYIYCCLFDLRQQANIRLIKAGLKLVGAMCSCGSEVSSFLIVRRFVYFFICMYMTEYY